MKLFEFLNETFETQQGKGEYAFKLFKNPDNEEITEFQDGFARGYIVPNGDIYLVSPFMTHLDIMDNFGIDYMGIGEDDEGLGCIRITFSKQIVGPFRGQNRVHFGSDFANKSARHVHGLYYFYDRFRKTLLKNYKEMILKCKSRNPHLNFNELIKFLQKEIGLKI